MSGIINSAGSRSGVIGTTELDYETGTFTPTSSISTSTANGTYTKIGRLVHVVINLVFDAGGSPTYGGLPFTSSSTAAMPGNILAYNIDWPAGTIDIAASVGADGTSYLIYCTIDDGAWTAAHTITSGDAFWIGVTYEAA